MPDVQWQINATENVSSAVQRIGQSLAGLDASDAKTFGQMVASLSRAQTAATQAQTALQRLETAQTQTAAAGQKLAQGEAATATAVQRVAQAQAQAAAAAERVVTAHAQAEAAQSRAAQAALRLQQAEQQAAQGMESVGRAAQQHSGAVSNFFSNALSAATGFLAANVFSRITGQIGDLVGGTVQAAASMEQTRAGFTSLLGSAQAADTLIKQLQQEANVSPFSLESFRKASQLLLGMGVAADDVVPRLHNVSNVVAAVGGGTEQFDRISLALGQIQAKGKLSAEEVNQLAESGVPAWDLLATALGKTKAQVIDLAQQGKISAETFNAAFAQFANSDAISQAAERNSHTFTGLLSTIGDVGQALETAFGTPVIAAVEPVLERIVTSLQDPAVITTLGQWGAAAGQFVVGLINAGQTAFTVAQQIIQALQPVTDFIGQVFGIQGTQAPTITPPDFTPAAQSAGQFGAAIKTGADNTKSAKDQVADLERQTRDLSRATAEANLGYDHRKQSLQDQLTLLDRQYQAENKAADIGDLQAKIAKDRALAVDQYSSQGQAAASRLVDEEARLKQLQREQGHDNQKNIIEDRIKAVDREKQANEEKNAAASRANQAQMDALRANAAATTALTNAIRPPAATGPDKSKNRNVDDAFGGPETASKAQGTIGWIQAIKDALTGPTGLNATVGALRDDWDLLVGSFDKTPASVQAMGSSIDRLINSLGGTGGMQGVMIAVNAEIERFVESATVGTPQILSRLGNNFSELADSITQAADAGAILVEVLKLQTGGGSQDALANAFARLTRDQQAAQQRHDAFVAADKAQGATHDSRIDQINKDVNARRDAALAAIDQNRVISSTTGGNGADFGNGPDFGPGVTTTTSRNAPPTAHVEITFDENGVAKAVQKHTSADRLLRVMGDAVR